MKRFRKGVPIVSIHTLIQALSEEAWVFYKDKPIHPNFIRNMTFNTVLSGIKAEIFYQALDNSKKEVRP